MVKPRLVIYISVFLEIMMILNSCKGNSMDTVDIEKTRYAIDSLYGKKIFFGHQSVGSDILEGIGDLTLKVEKELEIMALSNPNSLKATIIETHIGRNFYPYEKIDHFVRILESDFAEKIDVAFMKFCYVDSQNDISMQALANTYIKAMERLEKKYPETTFIYFTMPLTGVRTDGLSRMKNIIKTIINKPIIGKEDNIKRNEFNEMLRSEKETTYRLFDLAAIESTMPNGIKNTVNINGTNINALYSAYTSDGGHLSEYGRQVIAQELLIFLSNLITAD